MKKEFFYGIISRFNYGSGKFIYVTNQGFIEKFFLISENVIKKEK